MNTINVLTFSQLQNKWFLHLPWSGFDGSCIIWARKDTKQSHFYILHTDMTDFVDEFEA